MFEGSRIPILVTVAATILWGDASTSRVCPLAQLYAGQPAEAANPERDAFFGDMHIHTSWSIDAYVFGAHDAGPYEAIMFARGEPVRHPDGFIVQLKRPLDFMVLMDHSEHTGALHLANDPQSAFRQTSRGKELKAGKPGVRVADLTSEGAVALHDSQLKSLVVGKSLNVRNTVTGGQVQLRFGDDGRRLIVSADGKTPDLNALGDLLYSAPRYEIRDGSLITVINGTQFQVTVYKLGDKHFAARSYEFGYANYEVE